MDVTTAYNQRGYALVEQLVPREVAAAFLNRLKSDIEQSGVPWARLEQGHNLLKRDAIELYGYHYAPMLGLLWGLTPTVARLMGRDLLPSYAYFRIYREGDICRVHSDRLSCEHSASLTLDYSDGVAWDLEIGAEQVEPGPLVEEDFGGAAAEAVTMQPGDALLYQGVHHRHGRTAPNPNAWSAHLFLHWVERDGPYAAHAFDGRSETVEPVNFAV